LFFANFHIPDIASLPAGLFSTPAKLPWRHACIYPLPADLFSIPAGLQALPTALINNLFCFFFYRYIAERGDAENHDILTYFFQTSSEFFRTILYFDPEMFYLQKQLPKIGRHLLSHSFTEKGQRKKIIDDHDKLYSEIEINQLLSNNRFFEHG
jgi:hypothetical protein